jgi:hypothetical protein
MKTELKCVAIWLTGTAWLLAIGAATALLTGSSGAGVVIGVIATAVVGVANYDLIKEWANQ